MDLRKVYDELYGMIEDLKKQIGGGLSQGVDYETQVTNLPKVNNITLKGNKKSSDLKIAYSMTEAEYTAATKNAESIYCLQENAGTITDSAYVNLEVADWTEVSGVYKQTQPFVFEVTPAPGWTIEDVSIETGIASVDSYEVTEDPFGLSITYAAETLPEYGITATVTVTINQPAGSTRIVKNGIEFGISSKYETLYESDSYSASCALSKSAKLFDFIYLEGLYTYSSASYRTQAIYRSDALDGNCIFQAADNSGLAVKLQDSTHLAIITRGSGNPFITKIIGIKF